MLNEKMWLFADMVLLRMSFRFFLLIFALNKDRIKMTIELEQYVDIYLLCTTMPQWDDIIILASEERERERKKGNNG